MKAFQSLLYGNPNVLEIQSNISDMSKVYGTMQIEQEILFAISLRYKLIDIIHPFITLIKIDKLPHIDKLFLWKLYSAHLISLDDAQKFIPEYIPKEMGNLPPDNHQKEIEVHFGGELAYIIKHDDVNSLKDHLMFPNFDVNTKLKIYDQLYDYQRISLLNYAIQNNSIKCFRCLVDNGADITICTELDNGERWNATAFAASNGRKDVIEFLTAKGLKINKYTAAAAAKFHQNHILTWLKSKNIKFDLALLNAAQWNNYEALEFCLKNKADFTITNENVI